MTASCCFLCVPGPEEWDDYGVKLKPGEFKQTLSIGLTGIGGSLGARGAKGPRGRGAAARGVKKEERGQGSSKTELGVKVRAGVLYIMW